MMETFKIKKADTQPSLAVTLQHNNGSPVDLTSSTIYFVMGNLTDFSTYRSGLAVIQSATDGTVNYNWAAADTGSVGTFWGEFEVNWGSGSLMTLPNNHNLKVEVLEDYN